MNTEPSSDEPSPFLYQTEIEAVQNCPPDDCVSSETDAFRFCFEPIDHCDNFLPPAKRSPARKFKNSEACVKHGLSLFASKDHAIKKYNQLAKKIKMIEKLIGTHVAKARIGPEHGLRTKPNKSGHFTLFQASSCDLTSAFTIEQALKND